jgi:YebC/PmpR family DNA-binding regulatory protein
MSGHSKWKKIKRQKGAADVKKGNLFTKLGQAIAIAVREGGGADPDMNFMLRIAIDKARESNMPKDTIERAIDKGLGKSDEGELEEVVYDIVGKDGVALLVGCLTDNKNRTVTDIRQSASDYGFSLGNDSATWQFGSKGRIIVTPVLQEEVEVKGKKETKEEKIDSEELMLQIMEYDGVEDVFEREGGIFVITRKEAFAKVYEKLKSDHVKVVEAGMAKLPKSKIKVDDEFKKKIKEMISKLEEIADVLNVWPNVDLQ